MGFMGAESRFLFRDVASCFAWGVLWAGVGSVWGQAGMRDALTGEGVSIGGWNEDTVGSQGGWFLQRT